MQVLTEELESWLRAFAGAVRNRDFQAGQALFDEKVVSFGTACFRADGLPQLVADQWSAIWPNTQGFDFDYASAVTFTESTLATIAANWNSTGLNGRTSYQRRGRVTIVLRQSGGHWKAIHTHFSLEPSSKNDPILRNQ